MSDIPDATETPSTKAVFDVAWPLMLKAMMLNGIVVIDTYLVSALGEDAVAAMGLAAAFGGLLLGILFAFSSATQIRIAQSFGSARPEALKSGFYAGLIVNLGAAAIGLAAVSVLGGRLIDEFAQTPWIAAQARGYLGVFLLVILFEAVGQTIGSYFNGCGRTRTPFLSYLVALPVNVAVSYALVYGAAGAPELGVTGAAVGSAVASLVRALFLWVSFRSLTGALFANAGERTGTLLGSVGRHLAFSLPIAGTFVSTALAGSVAALLFARMSVNQFAAITLILPWVNVAGTIGMSWAQATGIVVAQLLGRGRTGPELDPFLRRAWRTGLVAAVLVALAYLVICLAAGRIYGDLEAGTIADLQGFLPVLLLLPFPKQSNAMCGQTLRAGGDTLYVMNIFIASQWMFRIPLTALFIFHLDLSVTWVFSLLLFEEIVKFPSFHLRFFAGRWRQGFRPD